MRRSMCYTWLAVSLLAALLLIPRADASGCRTRAIYTTYQAPAAVTYSAAYVAPAVATYAAPIHVAKVAVNPDYYSSVSDHYRDKLLVDAVAGKTAELLKGQQELSALREEVGLLRRQLQQQFYPPQQQQYQPMNNPPPEQLPAPAPQQMPRAGTGATGQQTAATAKLAAYVQSACLRCHGANYESAGFGIDLRDLNAVSWETRLLVYEQMNTGQMPKGGKPAPDEMVLASHEWYREGRRLALGQRK